MILKVESYARNSLMFSEIIWKIFVCESIDIETRLYLIHLESQLKFYFCVHHIYSIHKFQQNTKVQVV